MAVQEHSSADEPPRGSILNDPRVRSVFYQLVVVAIIVILGWEIVSNTMANLKRQEIASGFGFLENTAGFGIIQTLVHYTETSNYGRALLVGLLNTMLVAVIGVAMATIIGFIVGVGRLSSNWIIAKLAYLYVEILRNIPLLLQIFFWYFAVLRAVPSPRNSVTFLDSIFINNRGIYGPKALFGEGSVAIGIALLLAVAGSIVLHVWARKRQEATGQRFRSGLSALGMIIGLPVVAYFASGMPVSVEYPVLRGFNFVGGLQLTPEFVALVLALSIYTASFIAEIVRAGILAVSHGQTEAAGALGLRPGPTLRLVVIPQAMRVIIPPLTSQYLNLTKNSSLAVAIAYPDLVSVGGTVLNQTGQAIEIIGIWMFVYLSLSLITSAFMNWYNQRMALVER
ncbi:general L-amino acid transport system permease protein [Breoghania corrubedonensis]|uniref:General L-amino acid transport system permease protein n=1 Tax=Breoghania corrubedonensis TaxID=665038 RepID=A0A2T5VBA8_9HYPH|nr:amino acid ABC transporter permease [Breoghania corrubedonensis]PTW61029.1 general L-amino acid transport system permease protein [Breoghania corrubedonensis]